MSVTLVTGSAGLVGSEASEFFAQKGFTVAGIDNDMRRFFFGSAASTLWLKKRLKKELGRRYHHHNNDIRGSEAVNRIFKKYGPALKLVIHTAAQPSHDWAARRPLTDFTVNSNGTLNLLEAARRHAPRAAFIFTSTNKVYGDTPNRLPLLEKKRRFEISPRHTYSRGIREDMSIDQTMHSLFGASKASADLLVQEYGRYFGMNTVCFRLGCITGPRHSGSQLHGFLSYLMRCAALKGTYTIFGYKGKQVRDNIHSLDLIRAFWEFFKAPRPGEVYNLGGGRFSNCSVLEAIEICEKITGEKLKTRYSNSERSGDHKWWISANSKFISHYPAWRLQYSIPQILDEIYQKNIARWKK